MKKKKHGLFGATAILLVLVLLTGLLLLPEKADSLMGQEYSASVNNWNRTIDNSNSGEPIPGQYIVKKKNGDIELVKTKKGIDSLKEEKDIVSVEQNRVVTALDVESSQKEASAIVSEDVTSMQYGDDMVRAPEAWDMLSEDTATVRVAVIDTGIDATHPDLQDRVIKGTTIIDANASGNKYADDGKDDHGHGTHVSGIIAATWNNGMGIDGIAGKAEIELLPVKVLNDAGKGSTYDIIEGIRYAADHGASILNMSLGSTASSQMEAEAIAYAQNKGCLVIAAAGNDAVNVSTTWPASYDGVISVGSVDAQEERSYFSNYGETLDVAAPGSDIISSIPKSIALQQSAQGYTVYGNEDTGYYISWSGTSMATPHAVGAAALYKAVNPGVTGADIGELMIQTCRDVGDIGKDVETGSGIIDAAAMLGAEVVKTPLKIKSPKARSELYEEVLLTAQVNPTMDIKTLKFYLDKEEKDSVIGQTTCDENNSFYEITWDTKKSADGDHTLLAAVYDSKGEKVGETQNIAVKILNTITDGFTLQVEDPQQGKAQRAAFYIYGQKEDGTYRQIKSGSTSELGYSRVKGLSNAYSQYLTVINGKYTTEQNTGFYIYKHALTSADLGKKITITGQDARNVQISTETTDGGTMGKYYLRLRLQNGNEWIPDLNPVVMNSDTELHLDDGVYRAEVCRTADEKGRAYLLNAQWSITSLDHSIEITAKGASRITADYGKGINGILELTGKDRQDSIPFLSGNIRGSEIYVSPGGEYIPSAEMTAEQDGQQWKLSMEKKNAIQPDGSNIAVEFKPDIRIREFNLRNLKEDSGTLYMYAGGTLTSRNVFGDENGDTILQAAQTYPTFKIYKVVEGRRQLVYGRTDRGNADSCYWNSKTDYNGNVPPAAGEYIAQLSYDAGPFGGESMMETVFQMRNRSGGEEMTSSVTMDGSCKMSRARLSLYTWNQAEGKWKQANSRAYSEAGEDGVIRNIGLDTIDLQSDINVAVLTFNGIKEGYQLPQDYTGFAAVPFTTIEDLQEIDLKSEDMKQMSLAITDQYGNSKSGKVSFPAASNGGKLAEAKTVTDVELNVKTGSAGRVYIPKGSYDYVYSRFNDSAANYFLAAQAFDTEEIDKIKLDGEKTETLTLNIDKGYKNGSVLVKMKGAEESARISTAVSNVICMTPGDYSMGLEVYNSDETYRYRVRQEKMLSLSRATQWSIGSSFTPALSLKQKTVAENQSLLGELNFHDGNGNLLTAAECSQDGFYEAVYPVVNVGAESVGQRSFSLGKEDGFSSFIIDPEYYYGEGPHYVSVSYDLGSGIRESIKSRFIVGLDYEPRLTASAGDSFRTQQISDGEIKFTAGSSTRGYLPVKVTLNSSSRGRTIVFTQYRDGKKLQTLHVKAIFASKENNTLLAAFNIRPGDEIYVIAK